MKIEKSDLIILWLLSIGHTALTIYNWLSNSETTRDYIKYYQSTDAALISVFLLVFSFHLSLPRHLNRDHLLVHRGICAGLLVGCIVAHHFWAILVAMPLVHAINMANKGAYQKT